MIELDSGNTLDISLREDSHGRDRVLMVLREHGCELDLSPHQARVLATELIMAVNRAEVRNNLKHTHNVARGDTPEPRPQRRGPFQPAFAK